MKFLSGRFTELTIILVTGLLFIPFLGNVHLFDWDEINFAEAAREMIKSGNYLTVQIDFQPFWEKPPLFIWMQVLSMKIFGINEFAARFPNAVCGIVTSLAIFKIGKRLKDENSGIIWVCVYMYVLYFLFFILNQESLTPGLICLFSLVFITHSVSFCITMKKTITWILHFQLYL